MEAKVHIACTDDKVLCMNCDQETVYVISAIVACCNIGICICPSCMDRLIREHRQLRGVLESGGSNTN